MYGYAAVEQREPESQGIVEICPAYGCNDPGDLCPVCAPAWPRRYHRAAARSTVSPTFELSAEPPRDDDDDDDDEHTDASRTILDLPPANLRLYSFLYLFSLNHRSLPRTHAVYSAMSTCSSPAPRNFSSRGVHATLERMGLRTRMRQSRLSKVGTGLVDWRSF